MLPCAPERVSTRILVLLVRAALAGLAIGIAPAQAEDVDPGELPPEVERPDFLRNRPFIPDELLKDKREGQYVTGIPAVGWDAEEGFNVGAFLELYDNGSKDDPFFRTTPYRRKIFVGGVVTTEQVFRLAGRLDWPNIADSPYRFRIDARFDQSQNRNYFGVGKDGEKLRSPLTGRVIQQFTDYQDDLDTLVPGGSGGCPPGGTCTYARYNHYAGQDAAAVVSLERDMLGGLLRPQLGFQARWVGVQDLSGDRVDQVNGSATARQLPTRLFQDCQLGIAEGCGGGWDNFVKLGLTWDSRDFAPNPTRGILAEASTALSAKAFGSLRGYQRFTFSGSAYRDLFEPLDTRQNLIAAGRITYHMVFGDVPFFALPKLGFNDYDRDGLGGFLTLRGLKGSRLVGRSDMLANAELRWFFTEWNLWGQHLRPGLAGFVDTGRAFDDVTVDFRGWRFGAGAGFRLAWNLATLVSFDLGLSTEDSIFYMELGTAF
jgi:hypothetical protein